MGDKLSNRSKGKELHGIKIYELINILRAENPWDYVYSWSFTLAIIDRDGKHQGSIALKKSLVVGGG